MKKTVFVLLTIICVQTFKLQVQDQQPLKSQAEKLKLPGYTGRGYHLLQGNPFTNHIDQGFRARIFQFTYDRGLTTQDGKYLIPDFTSSTQSTSCSLESKVTQFTGTQNYQKYLNTMIKYDFKLSIFFIKAAFSYSKTFEQFSNSTQTHNQTSSHSNAECTIYTAQMPFYSSQIKLNADFVEGVKRSYASGDWESFLDHFGSHYASTVVFGGRYMIEHTYTQETMSMFQSLKLDINFAAQVQFFNKIGIQLTQQMKRYLNQTNLISSKVSVERTAAIGGQPPKSGNWIDWANTVKENLAPVSYKLSTLSVLFNYIEGIDSQGAIKSYQDYLNSICDKYRCPPLTPDRPDPKPLVVSFSKTNQIRGSYVDPRTFDTNDGNVKVAMRVYKIMMGTQGTIDSIQFFLTNGLVQYVLPIVGTRNLNQTYEVPKEDEIKCIRFGINHSGNQWKFVSLQFVTKKGIQSAIYKANFNADQYRVLCMQDDSQHFIGFFGHYGNTFDSIGLNVMKEVIPK